MKILFSNPPWWEQSADLLRQGIRAGSRWPFTRHATHLPDSFHFGGYLPFPFFLAHAASYAQRHIPTSFVEMRDSVARGESYSTFFSALQASPPAWLVLETATPSLQHDLRLIEAIHRRHPATKIILTGTIVADRDFQLPSGVTAAIRGEYEKGVVAVIAHGARGIVDFNLLTRDELDELPYPMLDTFAHGFHWDPCPAGQRAPHLQIWTSRGCPFKCAFCGWPATMTGNDPDGTSPRSVRQHSPEYVEAMIRDRLLRAKDFGFEYRSIYIDDDTFNLTKPHTLAISAVMARIGLPWSAMCRADTLDEAAWQAMKDSGCTGVKVGVESGSQEVIDTKINKRLDLHQLEHHWLPLLKRIGLKVHTTWTEGMAGETPAQRAQTDAMIARLYEQGLHTTHQLSGTAEITGTPLHTMRMRGPLAKYPGATLDQDYILRHDGQKKVEEILSLPKTIAASTLPPS